MNKIEEREETISKEDLLKIERDIKNLKNTIERIFKIVNKLLYIIEKNKERHEEIIDVLEKRSFKKLPKGIITPQMAYKIPILETLYELEGRGEVKQILSILEIKMKGILRDIDYEIDNSGVVRWAHNAQWCRLKLVHEGLLKKDSPKGIWELSEEGYKFIEEYLKNKR
ncbi:MAG: winged helix-turn-helix domain-containing protein [Candidatus Methanomethylicaceae archaeon]